MTPEIIWNLLAILLLLPGIAAAFFPVFPALLYMLIVSLIYAAATGWSRVQPGEAGFLIVLTIVSVVIDQLSGVLGARYGGASRRALGWGFLGGLIGTFTAGPVGTLLGVFTAILLAELSQMRSHIAAIRAATGGALGVLAGILITAVLATIFFIAFIVSSFNG
jgi:uncharacterized protein